MGHTESGGAEPRGMRVTDANAFHKALNDAILDAGVDPRQLPCVGGIAHAGKIVAIPDIRMEVWADADDRKYLGVVLYPDGYPTDDVPLEWHAPYHNAGSKEAPID